MLMLDTGYRALALPSSFSPPPAPAPAAPAPPAAGASPSRLTAVTAATASSLQKSDWAPMILLAMLVLAAASSRERSILSVGTVRWVLM
jgi:hypothetical protein